MQENTTNPSEEGVTGVVAEVATEVAEMPVVAHAEEVVAVTTEVAETAVGEVVEALPAVEVADASPTVVA